MATRRCVLGILGSIGATAGYSTSVALAVAAEGKRSDPTPPRVAAPCRPGACAFDGQTVRFLAPSAPMQRVLVEVKEEFESATGARLEIAQLPRSEAFGAFIADSTNRTAAYDATVATAWSLGDLVAGRHILPYDRYYRDPRFPKWDMNDVLPGPRALLRYAGRMYMVACDHDGQVMYYRRDLLASPAHREGFAQRFGYTLGVPKTWEQVRDIAQYFNGKDLNGDGIADHGLALHFKVGEQAMFHFMSLSAPFVIGPANRERYWFDPKTMRPLITSPGHVRALSMLTDLVKLGPQEMLNWSLQDSWDHFLAGRAALTFSWGNLAGMAQETGSVRGRLGVSQLPGTSAYYSIPDGRWHSSAPPNLVGNVTGGSWAGVISAHSKVPEATYYLLALLAVREKAIIYAARGWDGIDPGRHSQFLAPQGTASLETYLRFGWDEADTRDYSRAYYQNFSSPLLLPFLRIPGAFTYRLALDVHLGEAVRGRLSPEEALKATAVDFEEITVRLGRDRQRVAYRASLGP